MSKRHITKAAQFISAACLFSVVVNALFRRTNLQKADEMRYKNYVFDFRLNRIWSFGKLIEVTNKEFALASIFFRNLGRVMSRTHLLDTIWCYASDANTRTLDTHIHKVRVALNLKAENGYRIVSTLALVILCSCGAWATTGVGNTSMPMLVIDEHIAAAIYRHPTVRAEFSQGRAAQADLEAAKLRRYPNISVKTESGPVGGSTLTVEQMLWSGGREAALVDSAQAGVRLHESQLLETQYQIALRVIEACQSLNIGVARVRETGLTRQKLDELQELMLRRVESGVSPKIELSLITTRVAQSQVDMQQARAMANSAAKKLEVLLGQTHPLGTLIGPLALPEQVKLVGEINEAELLDYLPRAIENHPALSKARFQAQAAQYEDNAQQAARWPQVYARYQKTIGGVNNNSTADGIYVGLSYQPGAGFSSLAQAKSSQARAEAAMQGIDVVQSDLQDSIHADIEDFAAARGRTRALAQAVSETELIEDSYKRQFVAGRRTWQDVMNAVRENSDVRLSLVEAQASVLGAVYRLRTRMGNFPWQQAAVQPGTP